MDAQLGSEEMLAVKDAFNLYAERDRTILPCKFAHVMLALGEQPTQDEIDRMLYEVSAEFFEFIEFDDFARLYIRTKRRRLRKEQVHRALKTHNVCDDQIQIDKIADVLRTLGHATNERELGALLCNADQGAHGLVSVKEFYSIVETVSDPQFRTTAMLQTSGCTDLIRAPDATPASGITAGDIRTRAAACAVAQIPADSTISTFLKA